MSAPIVVPLDGSQLSERALPLAVSIARRAGAPVHLITAHEPQPPLPVGATFDELYDPAWYAATAPARRDYLERSAEALREDGVEVVVAIPDGFVVEAVLGYADRVDAMLLVVATHGRGGISRLWLGSTTDRLLREASLPMLVVRATEEEPPPAAEPAPRRVMIPLDGSALAEQVLESATALGAALDWEYELIRVAPVPYTIGSPFWPTSVQVDEEDLAERRAEAEAYLEGVRERLEARSAGVVRTRTVEGAGGRVAEAILQAAGEAAADVIALATHGRGGLRRLVLGSVADKLIRAADVPLLVYRPEEPETSASG